MEIGTALGIVGIAVTLPALAESCISYSYKLSQKLEDLRTSKVMFSQYVSERQIYSKQLELSLSYVKEIAPGLSDELREVIQDSIFQLHKALADTLELLGKAYDADGKVRKIWFICHGKTALEKSLRSSNKAHDVYLRCLHYSVLLGGMVASGQIAAADKYIDNPDIIRIRAFQEAIDNRSSGQSNSKLLIEDGEALKGNRIQLDSLTDIHINTTPSTDGTYLFENRYYNQQNPVTLRRVRDIAMVLHNVDDRMAILTCTGFYPTPGSSVCELVFGIPEGTKNPRTLRDILMSPENAQGIRHSLSARLNLAIRVATAVLYVHTAKLVHKNIRPENIVLFERLNAGPKDVFPYSLGTAYLMGFDFARKEDEASSRTGDNEWNKNIYRHPERYGIHPEANYNMLHDIYSLGVVLLEIALWRSFVASKTRKAYDGVSVTQCVPSQACRFTDKNTGKLKSPRGLQEALVQRAEEYTPLVLGDKYRDVVVMCLTGLEGGFGDVEALKDQDGVIVGLVFMQKVLGLLEEITL